MSVNSHTVQYSDAVSTFNTCAMWADKNDVIPADMLILDRLQEKVKKVS